jgi:hypothetical protein
MLVKASKNEKKEKKIEVKEIDNEEILNKIA